MKILVIHQESTLYTLLREFCANSNKTCLQQLEINYAKDTSAERFGSLAGYCQKMEQEGPEWFDPDPNVLNKIADADIVLTEICGINKKTIDAAQKLKLITTVRSAAENINCDYAAQKGIPVCVSPSRLANAVADMTIALILSECRGLLRRNLRYTNGNWVSEKYRDDCHGVLSNLKVGLVGYGGIGKVVARRLIHGFDCQVFAYEAITPPETLIADGVTPVSLDMLCSTCDIISMHARLVPQTERMFGREQFQLMKPNAIFINTARAGLVDESALIEALQTGTIRGAGLDVYSTEPLPEDSPLLQMDNVTLMPHAAGDTSDKDKNSLKIIIQDIERFLCNEKLQFQIPRR